MVRLQPKLPAQVSGNSWADKVMAVTVTMWSGRIMWTMYCYHETRSSSLRHKDKGFCLEPAERTGTWLTRSPIPLPFARRFVIAMYVSLLRIIAKNVFLSHFLPTKKNTSSYGNDKNEDGRKN